MRTKRVYVDHSHFQELAAGGSVEYRALASLMRELVRRKMAVFPPSHVHACELKLWSSEEGRRTYVGFVEDVSRGYVWRHWRRLWRKTIELRSDFVVEKYSWSSFFPPRMVPSQYVRAGDLEACVGLLGSPDLVDDYKTDLANRFSERLPDGYRMTLGKLSCLSQRLGDEWFELLLVAAASFFGHVALGAHEFEEIAPFDSVQFVRGLDARNELLKFFLAVSVFVDSACDVSGKTGDVSIRTFAAVQRRPAGGFGMCQSD